MEISNIKTFAKKTKKHLDYGNYNLIIQSNFFSKASSEYLNVDSVKVSFHNSTTIKGPSEDKKKTSLYKCKRLTGSMSKKKKKHLLGNAF